MAVATTKAGPYYSSGEISFSSLRNNFRAQQRKTTSGGSETFSTDNAPISASQLLRNTSTSETSPIVPDATENIDISTSSDWKTSQFRNSIKFYYITQSGTDTNFDIDAQSWNTNLSKNINKFMFIDGTCGSNSATSSAIEFNATSYNLTVDVHGSVLGAAGRGGGTGSGAPDISGQSGGNAISVSSSGGRLNVVVRPGSRVYAGGGGGERGKDGNKGGDGRCRNETTVQGCGGAPGCPGGYNDAGSWGGGCCQSTCDWCWFRCCERCVNWIRYRRCVQEYTTSGGAGGAGGLGGLGRGYNNQSGSLAGVPGVGGAGGGGCGAGSGQTGETGGSGGEWGVSGSNTNNSGSGGSNGSAVTGSNFTVTGTINSSTVKGNYR